MCSIKKEQNPSGGLFGGTLLERQVAQCVHRLVDQVR